MEYERPSQGFFLLPTHVLFQTDQRALKPVQHVHQSPLLLLTKTSFIYGWKLRGGTLGCLRQAPAVLQQQEKKKSHENRCGGGVYLVGFTGELAATELALDLALGAVMLQVVGQVAARQLDGAAVGAGYHIEGAGGEVALREARRRRGIRHTHPHVGRPARPLPDNNKR